jgi:hypothetical protein
MILNRYWRSVIVVVCIGVACSLLQPKQPESGIATVLLVVAWFLTDIDNIERLYEAKRYARSQAVKYLRER